MAAKKPAKPRKFKQARKDAKSAAKKTFSGKSQARLKDPMTKLTADDLAALDDMKKSAKADLGKNAYLSKKDYDAAQKASREKFRSEMRAEFGEYGGKKAGDTDVKTPTREAKATAATKPSPRVNATGINKVRTFVTATPIPSQTESKKKKAVAKKETAKKAPAKKAPAKKAAAKPAVNKPATKGYAAGKTLNSIGQGRYDALIKEGVAPKSAMNKALFFQEKGVKTQVKAGADKATKAIGAKPVNKPASKSMARPTDASLAANEEAYLKKTQDKLIKQGRLSGSKEVVLAKQGKEVVSQRATAKPAAAAAATPPKKKKFGKIKAAAKGGAVLALAAEGVSLVKGSTAKDVQKITTLKRQLANLQGKKVGSAAKEGLASQSAQLASLASFGLVGKTRQERIAELKSMIKKEEAKKAKQNKGLRYGKAGESLIPGTKAYKQGSKVNPYKAPAASGGSSGSSSGNKPSAGAGGSTIKPGSAYRVKRGDTLSGIAKTAGVNLSDIMKANKKFTTDAKYKGGNMIWADTRVKIPKKK